MRHSIRRGLVAASALAIASLALAGCMGSSTPDDTGGADGDFEPITSLKLQLQWLPQTQFAGYYLAQDQGYLQRRRKDVRERSFQQSAF